MLFYAAAALLVVAASKSSIEYRNGRHSLFANIVLIYINFKVGYSERTLEWTLYSTVQ